MRKDVCNELRERIINVHYKPGEALNEKKLAEELGVSRTPIREALIRLSEENMVTIIPRSGARVSDINLNDIQNLIGLRLILERGVARLAALNVSEKDIKRLEKLLDKTKRVKGHDYSKLIDCDREFHQIIVDAARNPLLEKHLSIVRNQFTRIEKFIHNKPEGIQKDIPKVIQALRQKNIDKMEQLMVGHVELFVAKLSKKLFQMSMGKNTD
ncbi:MAG: GntR family transcriptional regulator [Deltaproteobacteria bacterium]|nr:GntR family transcriptional regulator [Deltaproteobacteria bacterium]